MSGMPEGSFNSTKHQPTGRGSGGITKRGFRPGQSGNPGGRPRQDVTELARAHTADAILALVEALKRPKEAVPAAVALLDRGWGRPKQTIETDQSTSPILLHLLAARAVSQQLMDTLGQRTTIDGHVAPDEKTDRPTDLLAQPPPLE
jgi:hypothetical protein